MRTCPSSLLSAQKTVHETENPTRLLIRSVSYCITFCAPAPNVPSLNGHLEARPPPIPRWVKPWRYFILILFLSHFQSKYWPGAPVSSIPHSQLVGGGSAKSLFLYVWILINWVCSWLQVVGISLSKAWKTPNHYVYREGIFLSLSTDFCISLLPSDAILSSLISKSFWSLWPVQCGG